MNQDCLTAVLNGFATVSLRLAHKLHVPSAQDDLYSEMCYAYVRKNGSLLGKSLAYTIRVCKNEALNNLFRGKSICSKQRNGTRIISLDSLSEQIPFPSCFEQDIHTRLVIEKILEVLTGRERQVAELIMEGDSETEIASDLGMSHQRVNYLKKRIRRKAMRIGISTKAE